jgi:hypothetical protein
MFFEEFSDLLGRLAVSSGKLVLVGDFNFHVDDLTNPQAARFLDLLDCYNLKQHITGATHKANHTLDLVITRSCEDMIHSWSSMDTWIILLKVVDSCAPLKTCIVSSRPSAPWYTENISKERWKCRQLERRWRKSGLDMDKQQYYDQCKRVKDAIKSSKMNYYSAFILENKSDHKVLFNTIGCLLAPQK